MAKNVKMSSVPQRRVKSIEDPSRAWHPRLSACFAGSVIALLLCAGCTGIASSATVPTSLQITNGSPTAASASITLDQYGGDAGHSCVGIMKNGTAIPGATGFFYLYKDTNLKHWMFCDPSGNRFFYECVQVIDGYYGGGSVDVNAKYGGGPYDYFSRQVPRLQALGFNSIGEYAHLRMLPVATQAGSGNPNKMPFVYLVRPSLYAPVKHLNGNLPPVYTGYRGSSLADVFDPAYQTYVNTIFSATDPNFPGGGTPAALDASPWLIGVTMDDTDELWTLKNGGHPNIGWIIGVSAPYWNYVDTNLYSKNQFQMALTTEYGTIGALNASWGSSYTTFGSSATTVANEAIGNGTGSQTTFTHTFAHTVVDPVSVSVYVNGVLTSVDCPWFNTLDYSGNCHVSANNGIITPGGTISSGTMNYDTGAVSITFSSAPANGVAITASYQYGGWPKASSHGTGFMDEDGSSSWYPTDWNLTSCLTSCNGQVATDLNAFVSTFATRYFATVNSRLRAALPHHLIVGPDAIVVPNRAPVLAAEASNVDVMFFSGIEPGISGNPANVIALYNTYGIPMIPYTTAIANEDSSFYGIPTPDQHCLNDGWSVNCYHSQALRGAGYFNNSNSWFNSYVGADAYDFIVGWDWWQYVDRNNESENFGVVSLNDNLYDGLEDTTTKRVDPWGFVTTPETSSFGDFISNVKSANRIWLGSLKP
jgi:hypothetical protein